MSAIVVYKDGNKSRIGSATSFASGWRLEKTTRIVIDTEFLLVVQPGAAIDDREFIIFYDPKLIQFTNL